MKPHNMVLSAALVACLPCAVLFAHRSTQVAAGPVPTAKHTHVKPVVPVPQYDKGTSTASPLAKSMSAAPVPVDPEDIRQLDKSARLADQGNAEIDKGEWQQGEDHCRRALAIWAENGDALYGLGKCAENAGDIMGAVGYYRKAVYTNDPNQSSDGYRENHGGRLMEYVLLLSQAGQTSEAMTIYRRATHVLNYIDGHQNVDVLLPDFRPGGWAYTPQRLRAMAHIGIALDINGNDDKSALAHLQKAVALAPDSPLPYFYRGQCEDKCLGNPVAAKADYEYARRSGGAQVEAGVAKAKMIDSRLR